MNQLKLLFISLLVLSSCGLKDEGTDYTLDEQGQQIGDLTASIDESSGSNTGTISYLEGYQKTFIKYGMGGSLDQFNFLPSAHAATCALSSTFSACSSNTITRDFNNCTIGTSSVSGTVTLTWVSSGSCMMSANGNSVTRSPSFTVTGPKGGTLTVSKVGTIGQRITRSSAGVFAFSNDGIRRVIAKNGSTLYDFTTSTTSDVTVTGASRSSRVLSGGSVRVTNNSNGKTCDYVPSAVTWSATCNCPVSGSWSGTCNDSESTTISITGCGSGTITKGSTTTSLVFDRCYGV